MMGGDVGMVVKALGAREGSGGGGGTDLPNAKVTAVVTSGNYRI